MIKELKLTDWKSFEQASLFVDPLTILIGTNASGKSNTLDALLFLQRVTSGISIFQALNGDVNLAPIRGGMEWICRKPAKKFSLAVTLGCDDENRDYLYELTVQLNGAKAEIVQEQLSQLKYGTSAQEPKKVQLFYTKLSDVSAPEIPVSFSTTTKDSRREIAVNRSHIVLSQAESLKLHKELMEGVKLVLGQLQQIFVFDPIPSHMRNYTAFSELLQTDGSNIAGVLAAMDTTRKQEVEKILTAYLRELPERDIKKIWTETVGKFQTDAMLYCEEGWPGSESHIVDARGMSDGTLRYLAVVTAMLTRKSGSLLVIEEVDNGLHPSRAHLLVKMLRDLGKSRGIDVIVTTHNPALLDAAGVRMVPFITVVHRDNSTGTSLLTQLEDIKQLPKLFAAGSLGQLSTEGKIETTLRLEREV